MDDEEFPTLVISTPEVTWSGFELRGEERDVLSNLDAELFEAESLEGPISGFRAV